MQNVVTRINVMNIRPYITHKIANAGWDWLVGWMVRFSNRTLKTNRRVSLMMNYGMAKRNRVRKKIWRRNSESLSEGRNRKKLNFKIYSHIGEEVCLFALAIYLVMVSIDQISGSYVSYVADLFFDTCTHTAKRITFDRNRLVFRNRLCYTLHTMVRARRRAITFSTKWQSHQFTCNGIAICDRVRVWVCVIVLVCVCKR